MKLPELAGWHVVGTILTGYIEKWTLAAIN